MTVGDRLSYGKILKCLSLPPHHSTRLPKFQGIVFPSSVDLVRALASKDKPLERPENRKTRDVGRRSPKCDLNKLNFRSISEFLSIPDQKDRAGSWRQDVVFSPSVDLGVFSARDDLDTRARSI